jgi:plastocyanin
MTRWIPLFIVAVVCCAAVGADEATTRPSSASPPTTQVSIDNFTFAPEKLVISAGTKVTWTNHDDVPHTATSSVKPRAFDSGALDTDQQFSKVFNTPGVYPYFCAVHPHMTAQIIVK